MKDQVKLVVVIPVGGLSSKNRFEHIVDTVESVIHYATPSRRIVIQDNSSPLHLGQRLLDLFPELTVVRAPINYGMYGGLYKSISLALIHIHAAYDFEVLYKMDTDALLTGYGLEDDALAYFRQNPNVGQLGTYLHTGDGIAWPRSRLRHETSAIGWLRDRKRCATLRYYLQMAHSSGYVDGEHILGGVAIYSAKLITRLAQGDFLLREELRRTRLQEDHLFSLLCKSVGLDLASFELPEHPFAIAYQGLPAAPEALAEAGAKAIHSTRFWQNLSEDSIRAFFKARRDEQVPAQQ
ncbi:MAG: hypothetical protein SNJ59_08645 [Aggregatilineales bacterium]